MPAPHRGNWLTIAVVSMGTASILADLQETAQAFALIGFLAILIYMVNFGFDQYHSRYTGDTNE